MKLIIVENFHPDILDYKNETIFALNPKACSDLDDNGVFYNVLDSLGSFTTDNKFFSWFESFIKVLQFHHFKNTDLVFDCVAPLHSMIPNFINRALQYEALFDNHKPEEVIYFVSQQSRIREITQELEFKRMSIFHLLYSSMWKMENPNSCFIRYTNDKPYKRLTSRFRDTKYIRGVLDYIRCLEFLPKYRKENILFVNRIPNEIRDAKLKGYGVNIITPESYLPQSSEKNSGIHNSVYQTIEDNYGIPIKISSRILDRVLEYYVYQYLPLVLRYKEAYLNHFRQVKYDCVVFRHRTVPYQFGAYLATKEVGIKTVYIRHGWDAFYNPITYKVRRGVYDYFVCPTEDSKESLISKGVDYEVL